MAMARSIINDLTIVLCNYNQSLGSSGGDLSAVPEPGALALWPRAWPDLLRRRGGSGGKRRRFSGSGKYLTADRIAGSIAGS